MVHPSTVGAEHKKAATQHGAACNGARGLGTGNPLRLNLSHNLKAQSEGEDRTASLMWEEQYMRNFHDHPKEHLALMDSWNNWILKVKRLGASTSVPWLQSRMQGMDGFAASAKHAHIMIRYFMTKLSATGLNIKVKSGQGQTNIDDVIWLLYLEKVPTTEQIEAIWSLLHQSYLELGFRIEDVQSTIGNHKAVFLFIWILLQWH